MWQTTKEDEATVKIFDVRDVPKGVDAQLAVVENPNHRHILKNYRRHGLLEVSGLWPEILIPELTVEDPVYRISENGHTINLDGMAAVRGFYRGVAEAGDNVFGPLEEEVAVSDYGIFSEALFAHVVPGSHPLLKEDDAEPEGFYQVSTYIAMAWPYVGGRLQGEHVYEDRASRKVVEVSAEAFTTAAQARELLKPLLSQTPLEDVVAGLSLFQ
jgi:hypothetical protein